MFASIATQHGGQENTILTFHPTLVDHGMNVLGQPYAAADGSRRDQGRQPLWRIDHHRRAGERMPSEQELAMARFQGRHETTIASKLFG